MSKFIKLIGLFVVVSFVVFSVPIIANAHGGFDQISGNIRVRVNQNPISPFVKDKVTTSLVLMDLDTGERLKNTQVELKIIKTFYKDPSKDTSIFTSMYTTDKNGAISFNYTFTTVGVYDVELVFLDQTGETREIGYLVQVVDKGFSTKDVIGLMFLLAVLEVLRFAYRNKLIKPKLQ